MVKNNRRKQKGFTLIELLVVIGILGVLATVLLVAINPLEQLARSRDAGRVSMVTQIGRAVSQYSVTQGGTGYLVSATSVMTTLKNAGELTSYLYAPGSTNSTNQPPCLPAVGNGHKLKDAVPSDTGFCYNDSAGSNDAFVWTPAESQTYIARGGCAGGTPYAAIVYIVSQGKAGVDCMIDKTRTPATGDVLK